MFLCSTIGQQRSNRLSILHVREDETDRLDLKQICDEFIRGNGHGRHKFAVLTIDNLHGISISL